MTILTPDIVTSLKASTDAFGYLNLAKMASLLVTDFQLKNQFEVLFYPSDFDANAGIGSLANTAINSLVDGDAIVPLYIKNIQGITLPTIEYININGIKHVQGISHPEEVTFDFIETETGTIRNFIQSWLNKIYIPSSPTEDVAIGGGQQEFVDPGLSINDKVNSEGNSFYYVFKDNQAAAKKNALIVFKGVLAAPTIGGWIKLEGLKIKSVTGFDLEQESEDVLTLSVIMSVDSIKIVTAMSALPF